MPQCPIEGCNYEHPRYESLRSHMQGKRDEPHEGIGFAKADSMLKAHGIKPRPEPSPEAKDDQPSDDHQGPEPSNEPRPSPDQGPEPQGLSPEEAYARGQAQAQATDGGVVPEAERHEPGNDHRADHAGGRVDQSDDHHGAASDDHHDEQEEYVECPRCESDQIVYAGKYMGRFRDELDAETTDLLRESDFVCWKCGGIFDNE